MRTSTIRDPRRRRPPFDVPSERNTRIDHVGAALIAVTALATCLAVWFTGSAADAQLTKAPEPQQSYMPSVAVPADLKEEFRAESRGDDAPLVTKGNLVTVEDDRVIGRAPGTGIEVWSYSHAGPLCAAAFFADRVVSVWPGGAGCSDVTAINGSTGGYAATRQSAFPEPVRLHTVWDHVMAFSPERLEIWRNDLVRTVEYGHVDAPQESGQQPRSGCTMRSAGLATDRFAVSERCPGDTSERLTISKTVPKDSRKPEETGSDTTGADELHVIAVVRDGVLAVRSQAGRWTVELYSSPKQSRTLSQLPGAPAVVPTGGAVAPGTVTARWFDGRMVHAFDRNTGAEKWALPATGPGTELGYGVGAPDQNQGSPSTLVPTNRGIMAIDSSSGITQREFALGLPDPGPAGVRSMAQIGDMIYLRAGGQIIAYKAR